MRRRKLLATAGAAAALGVSGCLGAIGMDEHEASPAGVEQAVREETGYEQTNVEELVVERTVDAVSEDITVTNYLTEHEKAVDLGPIGSPRAAAFIVLTSPQITLVGREFNPIAEMSAEELIGMIEADFDRINNAELVSEGEATVLGQETTEALFEAEAQVGGVPIDLNVHITESVRTTSDHLVTVGVYPVQLESQEADNIAALVGGIVEEIA
ncbi:DUF6517 family protein [Natronomonas sp.]|uniref:DUF6517 family protein n=1 Tax=Natronomonas sp. TaxID=2184060 RepID=UPI0026210781|nr:DUF6517 family protein [Natronomonas sp.]